MTRWRLTPAARRDLTRIWLHTVDRWTSDQADEYVRRIEHDLAAAANGSPLVQPIGRYWFIRSGSHFCVFDRTADGAVVVIRILHKRMDVDRHLP